MDLDDLAEYAGHKNTATIRHYARTDPLQMHRKIAKADTLSQVIVGLIDLQAAAGQPSVRWFLGYDADGLPQFCGLPAHQTCPHRMDSPHCGLFIGGENARLLSESKHVQPIWTEIPMTQPQQLLYEGQKEAAECELERLKSVPTPVPPSSAFLTNLYDTFTSSLQQFPNFVAKQAAMAVPILQKRRYTSFQERIS